MRKKLLTFMLSAMLLVPLVLGVAACGSKTEDSSHSIKVWVGEGTKSLTASQINAFNALQEESGSGIKFSYTIEEVSESVAAGNIINKPEDAPDIFCFSQDQLARLVQAKMLQKLNTASVTKIKADNSSEAVEAVTVGQSTLWAYPLTADNGFFMFYNKDYIAEDHIGSLEDIIQDCANHQRYFSMNLKETGGAWYAAPFFYGTGCESTWTTDQSGKFTDYTDTFNSANGIIALQGIQKVLNYSRYLSSNVIDDLWAAAPLESAVVVSGIWDYKSAEEHLHEKLGIAPLPKFTDENGSEHLLKSYLGYKMMGITPQSDPNRAYALQQLAMYLTGEQCQLERFNAVGWRPSNLNAQNNPTVTSPAISVLSSMEYIPQGQYPTNWWTKVVEMIGGAASSEGVDALRSLLSSYSLALPQLKSSN